MSVIHRAMQDCWCQLATDMGIEVKKCVSYSQLKRILRRIDIESFNAINVEYFGSAVGQQGQHWRSFDGKKESERPVVTAYFEQVGPLKDGYSFDALHTFPHNMELIDQRGGTYLAQVKDNQPGSEYIRIERKIDQKSRTSRSAFQTKRIFMNKPCKSLKR